jgi:hypothetical protein
LEGSCSGLTKITTCLPGRPEENYKTQENRCPGKIRTEPSLNTRMGRYICQPARYYPLYFGNSSSSSSTFLIRPPGLFPNRINLELWILWTVGRTHCTSDQLRRKAATYTGQHEQKIKADRHPCFEWDLNPRSQCLCGRRYVMPHTSRPLWILKIKYYVLVMRLWFSSENVKLRTIF